MKSAVSFSGSPHRMFTDGGISSDETRAARSRAPHISGGI
jgi:hypothetical protein